MDNRRKNVLSLLFEALTATGCPVYDIQPAERQIADLDVPFIVIGPLEEKGPASFGGVTSYGTISATLWTPGVHQRAQLDYQDGIRRAVTQALTVAGLTESTFIDDTNGWSGWTLEIDFIF